MQIKDNPPRVQPHRTLRQEEQDRVIRILLGVILLSAVLWIIGAILGAILGAITPGGSWYHSLTYQFMHANLLHLLLNTWATLGLAFFWELRVRDLIHAYIISAIFGAMYTAGWIPNIDLWSPVLHPTTMLDGSWLTMMLRPRAVVGLSSCIYAILGLKILTPAGKINRFVMICLATQVLIPGIAVTTHTTCFLLGALLSLITHPMIKVE